MSISVAAEPGTRALELRSDGFLFECACGHLNIVAFPEVEPGGAAEIAKTCTMCVSVHWFTLTGDGAA